MRKWRSETDRESRWMKSEGRKRRGLEADVREGLSCVGASNLIVTVPEGVFRGCQGLSGVKGYAFKVLAPNGKRGEWRRPRQPRSRTP